MGVFMYRFYVEPEQIDGQQISVYGGDVNHIKNVLRLKQGDWVILCDGENTDYYCRIEQMNPQDILCHIEKKESGSTELPGSITLFQGVPKGEKMELIIQKAVELGVARIVPVFTKRCVVKLDDKKAAKKVERWQKIAEAAAKQCGRGYIPQVADVVTYKEAVEMASANVCNLLPYECAEGIQEAAKIVEEAAKSPSVGIFIGPEGGFEEEEVRLGKDHGFQVMTLGKRILRTETAGIATLAILMFSMQAKAPWQEDNW